MPLKGQPAHINDLYFVQYKTAFFLQGSIKASALEKKTKYEIEGEIRQVMGGFDEKALYANSQNMRDNVRIEQTISSKSVVLEIYATP